MKKIFVGLAVAAIGVTGLAASPLANAEPTIVGDATVVSSGFTTDAGSDRIAQIGDTFELVVDFKRDAATVVDGKSDFKVEWAGTGTAKIACSNTTITDSVMYVTNEKADTVRCTLSSTVGNHADLMGSLSVNILPAGGGAAVGGAGETFEIAKAPEGTPTTPAPPPVVSTPSPEATPSPGPGATDPSATPSPEAGATDPSATPSPEAGDAGSVTGGSTTGPTGVTKRPPLPARTGVHS